MEEEETSIRIILTGNERVERRVARCLQIMLLTKQFQTGESEGGGGCGREERLGG